MNGQSKIWPLPNAIHPPAQKAQSLKEPISQLPLPAELHIPLTQPGHAAPELLVTPGSHVFKGQVLARGQGDFAATCHASSSGTLLRYEECAVPNASGLPELCAVIATDGEEEWQRLPALDPAATGIDELLRRIADAGIIGLGGAGFPSAAKVRALQNTHTLIINACECEPFITADEALLRERADEVVAGIDILLRISGAERCLIGIEDSKPQALAALRTAATALNDSRLSIQVVPTQYPSGGERQLIYMLTGMEIPSGHYPVESGILCQNVGTCHAIARAVLHGEALVSRVVTATGAALRNPGNFEVLIGTPLRALLEACELNEEQLSRLIQGGPLMGVQLPHANLPVRKTSNCFIATTDVELPPLPPARPCIRCGMCSAACPAQLLPQQLYTFARAKDFPQVERHNLWDCIECGACAYVCPSHIPLVQYFRAAKGELKDIHARQRMAAYAKVRFDFHQVRKAEEKVEEERRRRERAALAKQKLDAAPEAQDAVQAALARVQAKKAAQAEQPPPSPQDVIQAALERVNAKKAAKAAEEKQLTPQEVIQAAVARVNAKKAAKAAEAEGKLLTPEEVVQAAVARVAAKKAAKAAETAETKQMTSKEAGQATTAQAAETSEAKQSTPSEVDQPVAEKTADATEARQPTAEEVIQAAVARVNAKKAARKAAEEAAAAANKSDNENDQ